MTSPSVLVRTGICIAVVVNGTFSFIIPFREFSERHITGNGWRAIVDINFFFRLSVFKNRFHWISWSSLSRHAREIFLSSHNLSPNLYHELADLCVIWSCANENNTLAPGCSRAKKNHSLRQEILWTHIDVKKYLHTFKSGFAQIKEAAHQLFISMFCFRELNRFLKISVRPSIKPGTFRNIPEHPATLNNYDNYEKNMLELNFVLINKISNTKVLARKIQIKEKQNKPN